MTHWHMWQGDKTSRSKVVSQRSEEVRCYITLQHIAAHCNTLQHTAKPCNTLQHPATPCNTLPKDLEEQGGIRDVTSLKSLDVTTRCNILWHAAARCSTLQHTATHCNTLQHAGIHSNTLQHTATQPRGARWHQGGQTIVACWWSDSTPDCCVWMRHVTYEWVMHHIDEWWGVCWSFDWCVWMCQVTHEWVKHHIDGWWGVCWSSDCCVWMRHVTYEWVMHHMDEWWDVCWSFDCCLWMCYVTYEWVMHHMDELWGVCWSFDCCVWMCQVTYEWVMHHIELSHHSSIWYITHSSRDTFIHSNEMVWLLCMHVSCQVRMSDATHGWVVRQFHCCVWMCQVKYEWVMQHMDEWRDNFIAVYEFVMWRANEWCKIWMGGETIWLLCMNVSRDVRMSNATYGWVVRHMSIDHLILRCIPVHQHIMLYIWTSIVTHMNASCHVSCYGVATISRRLKSTGLFCKRAL